jgi:hypothetical protein
MKKLKLSLMAILALLTIGFAAVAETVDWNAIITEYGKLTDQMIAAYNKIKSGDTAAATEMQALAPKYQELSLKITQAAGTALTPEQIQKFQELGAKYQKAMTP